MKFRQRLDLGALDVEVYGQDPGEFYWVAYKAGTRREVATGTARTRFRLVLAIWRLFFFGVRS